MNIDDLRVFLIQANQAGYANPDTVEVAAEDGGHLINYSEGAFHFCDYYYGGEPFAGQEVIYYEKKPLWAMQYRGRVAEGVVNAAEVYAFLKRALMAPDPECPFRGPASLENGAFYYENTWTGTMEDFQGEEVIYLDEVPVYSAAYMGGLVDK